MKTVLSKKNRNRGFTLVELSIVLGVTVTVITLVATFLITYNGQTDKITKNNDAISDINSFKDTVNRWLDENDSGTTEFTVTDSTIRTGTKNITFSSGKLKDSNNETIALETISKCKFYKKTGISNVIYCDVTAKVHNKEQTVQLLFDINYDASRDRL